MKDICLKNLYWLYCKEKDNLKYFSIKILILGLFPYELPKNMQSNILGQFDV